MDRFDLASVPKTMPTLRTAIAQFTALSFAPFGGSTDRCWHGAAHQSRIGGMKNPFWSQITAQLISPPEASQAAVVAMGLND
jgi:hypothetical protein